MYLLYDLFMLYLWKCTRFVQSWVARYLLFLDFTFILFVFLEWSSENRDCWSQLPCLAYTNLANKTGSDSSSSCACQQANRLRSYWHFHKWQAWLPIVWSPGVCSISPTRCSPEGKILVKDSLPCGPPLLHRQKRSSFHQVAQRLTRFTLGTTMKPLMCKMTSCQCHVFSYSSTFSTLRAATQTVW